MCTSSLTTIISDLKAGMPNATICQKLGDCAGYIVALSVICAC